MEGRLFRPWGLIKVSVHHKKKPRGWQNHPLVYPKKNVLWSGGFDCPRQCSSVDGRKR